MSFFPNNHFEIIDSQTWAPKSVFKYPYAIKKTTKKIK